MCSPDAVVTRQVSGSEPWVRSRGERESKPPLLPSTSSTVIDEMSPVAMAGLASGACAHQAWITTVLVVAFFDAAWREIANSGAGSSRGVFPTADDPLGRSSRESSGHCLCALSCRDRG